MNRKPNWTVIGALTTLGIGLMNLVANKVAEEQMKAEVRRTVEEVLAERDQEEESE